MRRPRIRPSKTTGRFAPLLLAVLCVILQPHTRAAAQCDEQELSKIIASDWAVTSQFGGSVATSGTTTIVGAPISIGAGFTSSGTAYIFELVDNMWSQQARLTAFDASAFDSFGNSVAVSGNTTIIGAYQQGSQISPSSNEGAAYIFVRSDGSWSQLAKLTASDRALGDNFGVSVAMSGDLAIVGSYHDNHSGLTDAGSAYVFVRTGSVWTEQTKLIASDAASNDEFGLSVAISGNRVIVGAGNNASGQSLLASAYVFVCNNGVWTEEALLVAPEAAPGDRRGISVALYGDTVVTGAVFADGASVPNCGAADVFVKNGDSWVHQARLTALDAATDDYFGYSVAIFNDVILVGTYRDDDLALIDAGSTRLFVRNDGVWTEQAKLTASDSAASDNFGLSVAIAGSRAVVGAPLDDHSGGTNRGSVYAFDITCDFDSDLDGDHAIDEIDNCPEIPNSQQEDTDSDGIGDLCDTCTDTDEDNFGDAVDPQDVCETDNCPRLANTDQFDADGDGIGDLCDCPATESYTRITEAQPLTSQQFGASVAVSGEKVVIGADRGDTPFNGNTGAAYVFIRAGQSVNYQAKLLASDAAANDYFGSSVAVSDDCILVGAPLESPSGIASAGSAYVFTSVNGIWTQQAKLNASDMGMSDQFGGTVDISGETIVIGAPSDDHGTTLHAGSAYVFTRNANGWMQETKLTAPDYTGSDNFGGAVTTLGNTAVIGAPDAGNALGINAGAAYVFIKADGIWEYQEKLTAFDGSNDDGFGYAVSLDSDTLFVGAPRDNNSSGNIAGAVYVFIHNSGSWTLQAKLMPEDGIEEYYFGRSVSISGDVAMVGADRFAYAFLRTDGTWTSRVKLNPTAVQFTGAVGYEVAVSDDGWAVVGADHDDIGFSTDAGSAFIYDLNGCENVGDVDGDGIQNVNDNCLYTWNQSQQNSDSDEFGDACDNCPSVSNPDQADCNMGGPGNACEPDCNSNNIPDVCERGDFDGNACIGLADIPIFVQVLLDQSPCPLLGDLNTDLSFDGEDIQLLVQALAASPICP